MTIGVIDYCCRANYVIGLNHFKAALCFFLKLHEIVFQLLQGTVLFTFHSESCLTSQQKYGIAAAIKVLILHGWRFSKWHYFFGTGRRLLAIDSNLQHQPVILIWSRAGAAKARKIPTLLHLSAQQWDSFFVAPHCYLVCFSEWQISDKGPNPVTFFFDAIHHVPQT